MEEERKGKEGERETETKMKREKEKECDEEKREKRDRDGVRVGADEEMVREREGREGGKSSERGRPIPSCDFSRFFSSSQRRIWS